MLVTAIMTLNTELPKLKILNKVGEITSGALSGNGTSNNSTEPAPTGNSVVSNIGSGVVDAFTPEITLDPKNPWDYYSSRMMYMHFMCAFLHYLSSLLELKKKTMMSKFIMIIKVGIFLTYNLSNQAFLNSNFGPNSETDTQSYVDHFQNADLEIFLATPQLLWLLVELVAFYLNIISLIILMAVS
jgi:hypothetical protein